MFIYKMYLLKMYFLIKQRLKSILKSFIHQIFINQMMVITIQKQNLFLNQMLFKVLLFNKIFLFLFNSTYLHKFLLLKYFHMDFMVYILYLIIYFLLQLMLIYLMHQQKIHLIMKHLIYNKNYLTLCYIYQTLILHHDHYHNQMNEL